MTARIDRARERKQSTASRPAARRDREQVETALAALRESVADNRNLMLPLVDCVGARCTEGELVGSLPRVFGSYTETPAS